MASPITTELKLTGFVRSSDRPGIERLYFTRDLEYYAEFRTEDILHVTSGDSEQASQVSLRRDAVVSYGRMRIPVIVDEFDLDIRLHARSASGLTARADVDNTELVTRTCGTGPCDTCATLCATQCRTQCVTDCVTGCPEMCRFTDDGPTCPATCEGDLTCKGDFGCHPPPFDPPTGPSQIESACVGPCVPHMAERRR